jgi:hypothetical protein
MSQQPFDSIEFGDARIPAAGPAIGAGADVAAKNTDGLQVTCACAAAAGWAEIQSHVYTPFGGSAEPGCRADAVATANVAKRLTAAALLMSFTLWIGYMLLKNIRVRCGCFGRQSEPISWSTVLRNICLVVVAVTGAALTALTDEGFPTVSREFLVTATSLGAATALLVALRETIEFFNLSPRPPERSGPSEGEDLNGVFSRL